MADQEKSELQSHLTKSSSRSHLKEHPPKTAKNHLNTEIRTYHTATLKNIRTRARRSPSIPSHKISRKGRKKTSRPVTRRSNREADGEEQQQKEPTAQTQISPPTTANHTQLYAQEIGRINNIIKAVVKQVTASDKGQQPPADEIVRPLSADELGQLLQSIGNVATIHEDNIDVSTTTTTTNLAPSQKDEQNLEGYSEGTTHTKRKSKSRKSKRSRRVSTSSQKSLKLSNYIPLIKQGSSRQSSGTQSQKIKPGGKLSKEQMLINSKASGKKVSSRTHPSSFLSRTPAKKIRSMKSQVKALIKEEKAAEKSKSKSRGGSRRRRKSSKDLGDKEKSGDTAEQEDSDLDLIKTAILNKHYYEESLALAQSNSKENVQQGTTVVEGVLKKGKRGDGKKKSLGEKKKVSYAASLVAKSEDSIASKLEILRSVKKKTKESFEWKSSVAKQAVAKMDEKSAKLETRPVSPAANKSKKTEVGVAPKPAETDADKKKYLKDILVNQSHVTKQPESGNNKAKKMDYQYADDGEVYFTQKFETAPRFNAMNAELHDDSLKFKEFVEKNKPIQKIVQVPNSRGRTPNNTTTDGTSNERNRKLSQGEREIKPHTYQISELYSIKKDHKESPVRLRNIDSIWQQQSVYPSAYPSVVNRGRSSRFGDKEERWSTLNQRTVKKNEELKQRRVESGEIVDVRRRIHLATHKKLDVDDENKILDSFATYMRTATGNNRFGSAKRH